MSNIYIQEPPTDGKVLLETTAGDIDIELWSRECPKACRNFVQLCMEGYYNGLIFHRLIKGFIVQGGDPLGNGSGGSSVWGKPFKDEFHSRLRFMRRGLVAMANAGKDDNGSQFFFTLGPTPDLQNKHTIYGKVVGDTIYNMLKLEEGLVDDEDKPLYPHKILSTKILSNPFPDIVPRESIKKEKSSKNVQSKSAATKNYKLLSFGEEAEEEEEEMAVANQKFSGKSKSSHDLTNDPRLSSQPALVPVAPPKVEKKSADLSDEEKQTVDIDPKTIPDDEDSENEGELDRIKDRLKKKETKKTPAGDDGRYYLGKDAKLQTQSKMESIKKELQDLKKSMKKDRIQHKEEIAVKESEVAEKNAKLESDNSVIKEFFDEQQKYKEKKSNSLKKGADREAQTLALLAKFRNKIENAKETFGDLKEKVEDDDEEAGAKETNSSDISWLARSLHYDEKDPILAKDANTKSDDWFEIYDPRNPLNKRRREQGQQEPSTKWKKSKLD